MISQSAEYSLRAVVCLASRPETALTTHQIAEAGRVPPGYLAKILQALGRAGIVSSQRGVNGGFVLVADPRTLTLLDVVEVADPSRRIATCPLGIKSHGINLCPLHRRLDDAIARMEAALRETTIAELLADPSTTRPLCNGEDERAACQAKMNGD